MKYRVVRVGLSDGKQQVYIVQDGHTERNFNKAMLIELSKHSDIQDAVITKRGDIWIQSRIPRYNIQSMQKTRKGITQRDEQDTKIYYHGSNGGIYGDIDTKHSVGVCDFRAGFYLGEMRRQAESRVQNSKNPVVYEIQINYDGLKTYEFKDDGLWAIFIAYNRGKEQFEKYPKILKLLQQIEKNSDIIIGYIADDKIAYAYRQFNEDNLTVDGLQECLKLVKYGRQIVLKTDKACKQATIIKQYKININQIESNKIWTKQLKEDMGDRIKEINRQYKRIGLFKSEYLDKLEASL